jgi:integrase
MKTFMSAALVAGSIQRRRSDHATSAVSSEKRIGASVAIATPSDRASAPCSMLRRHDRCDPGGSRKSSVQPRVAPAEEAARLIGALWKEHHKLWATAFYAGLRRGELRALRIEDADLAAGVIRVERSWDDEEGPIVPKPAAGRRTVPIPGVLREYLIAHRLRQGRSERLPARSEATAREFGRATRAAGAFPGRAVKRVLPAWRETATRRLRVGGAHGVL